MRRTPCPTRLLCTMAAAAFLTAQAMAFSACSTTAQLTDSLDLAGSFLEMTGNSSAAKGLQAAASISKANEDITPENEYYIGRSVAASILTNYKTYENAAQERYLNRICAALVEHSEMPELFNGYHVKILDAPAEVNAFSTSGGHIFVTRGLLACARSEDALAAVIAHEIAHIQLHHSIDSIKASRHLSAALSTLSAAGSAAKLDKTKLGEQMSGVVGDAVENLVNKGFSKEQEFEADALALTLMADAGYSPDAMTEMLTVMKDTQGSRKGGLYKTHPSPAARIAQVKVRLKRLDAVPSTAQSRVARYQRIMGN